MKKFLFPLMFIFVVLLSACGGAAADEPQEMTHIKMYINDRITYGPLFIAIEEGYFEAQGLEVETVTYNRNSEALPLLGLGELDVLSGNVTVGTLNALANDENVFIVADKGHFEDKGCSFIGFLAASDLIGTEALEGENMANLIYDINDTSYQGMMMDLALQEYGLSIDDIGLADLPQGSLADGFDSGAITVTHQSEPYPTILKESGHAEMWLSDNDLYPDFQYAVVLFGPNLVVDNPEAGARFMAAYLQGVADFNEGATDRNVEIMAQYTELEPAMLSQMCWPLIHEDGHINAQSVIDFQEWAVGRGLLDQVVGEDAFWNGSFIEAAQDYLK